LTNQLTVPVPHKGWLPLVLITFLTVAILIVSVIALISGWLTIFQNLFYIPIILACVYYVKRGFVFSVLLACGYFVLMCIFSQDFVVLEGALIRVLIFILVAGVITYLSIIRIRAEKSLRESEERYSSLFDNNYSVSLIIDPDTGRIADANAAATRYYGYTHDELTSLGIYDLNRLPKETVTRNLRRAKNEKAKHFFSVHYLASGEKRNVEIYSGPITLHGNPLFYSITHDITDRKRTEEALRQANKQLNLLSGITRHDILNQLMALKGYLYLSHDVINNPTTLIEYITKEEMVANTIEHQITFTRDYQELGAAAPGWQNVNASIQKAVAGLPMRAVSVEVDPADPEVYADPLFDKVFYNLIDNALRYGGDQMKTIRVSSQKSDTSLAIVCEDDGVGITAEDKKRLFTRGFGKNTGLGLFLSREILAITGITITENGVPGKGARFEITVPKGMWRSAGNGA